MSELSNQNANLMSVSINQLVTSRKDNKRYCFLIPSYQRGYRWTSEQIVRLLNDLYEFKQSAQQNEIYCLQPIIVKAISKDEMIKRMGQNYSCTDDKAYYEVIDGQQRLTTIYLILKYTQREESAQFFDIEYERDAKSNFSRSTMLQNLRLSMKPDPKTVDENYFLEAYGTVKNWISEISQTDSDVFNSIESTIKKHTNIIWYELGNKDADCYQLFRNINNGKIPLTNAELVKAMLLSEKYFAPDATELNQNLEIRNTIIRSQQTRFARLWDDIQHALNNAQMWSFITGNHHFNTPTRIDFLLKLVAYKEGQKDVDSDYGLFNFYEHSLNAKHDMSEKREYIESIFESIRTTFRTIQDWYEEPYYFNYIGMIMTYTEKSGRSNEYENRRIRLEKLNSLMNRYNTLTREQFRLDLVKEIRELIKKIQPENIGIADTSGATSEQYQNGEYAVINYVDDRLQIERWLMLFNILELNEIGGRFDFTIGRTGWSVEHIKAQSSEVAKKGEWKAYLLKEKERVQAVAKHDNSNNYDDIIDRIKELISAYDANSTGKRHNNELDERLRELMLYIDKEVDGFEEADEHRLGNLALLGKAENSMLNNSQFYEKRQKMLSKESKNFPYATRHVFLKVYSEQTLNMDYSTWRKADFNSYLQTQYKRLKEFYATLSISDTQPNQNGGEQ